MVLGGVVWISIAGRHDPQAEVASRPSDRSPPAATALTLTPTQTQAAPRVPDSTLEPTEPPPSFPPRQPTPTPERFDDPLVLGQDAFALVGAIDGRGFLEVLHESETDPGHLTGKFRMPFSDRRRAKLELAQLWTRDEGRPNFVLLNQWPVRLNSLGPDTQPAQPWVDETVAADPTATDGPRLVVSGYRIIIVAESRGTYGAITIDVEIGPSGQE